MVSWAFYVSNAWLNDTCLICVGGATAGFVVLPESNCLTLGRDSDPPIGREPSLMWMNEHRIFVKNNLNSTKRKGQGGPVGCGDQMHHVCKAETNIEVMSKITEEHISRSSWDGGIKMGLYMHVLRKMGCESPLCFKEERIALMMSFFFLYHELSSLVCGCSYSSWKMIVKRQS